jgi:hypothetical protein
MADVHRQADGKLLVIAYHLGVFGHKSSAKQNHQISVLMTLVTEARMLGNGVVHINCGIYFELYIALCEQAISTRQYRKSLIMGYYLDVFRPRSSATQDHQYLVLVALGTDR